MATWVTEERWIKYSTIGTHPQTGEWGSAATRGKWELFTLPDTYQGGDNIVYKCAIKRVVMATNIVLSCTLSLLKTGEAV